MQNTIKEFEEKRKLMLGLASLAAILMAIMPQAAKFGLESCLLLSGALIGTGWTYIMLGTLGLILCKQEQLNKP